MIEYQSLTRLEKINRWISPHALGFDGFRWHCRAYCHIDNFFKDFILGRILRVVDKKNSEIDPKEDKKWETFITVKIGPNPELEENYREIIEHEYGMENGEASIQVRIAMLFYLLNNLNLNIEEEGDSLYKKRIVLLNKEEIKEINNS
jgi:predicted DNA-binding transcriptional regulator YafY